MSQSLENEELQEFAAEVMECLETAEAELMAGCRSRTSIDTAFRALHTIKGVAGMSGHPHIEKVAHSVEEILGNHRDTGAELLPDQVSQVLLSTASIRDAVSRMMSDHPPRSMRSEMLLQLGEVVISEAPPVSGRSPLMLGELLVRNGAIRPEHAAQARALQLAGDERRIGEILIDSGVVSPDVVRRTLERQEVSEPPVASSARLRQDEVLSLLELSEDLRLTVRGLAGDVMTVVNPKIVARLDRMDSLLKKLDKLCVSLVRQPIGHAWRRLGVFAERLAQQNGKRLEFVAGGESVLADRVVVEAISAALLHLVRNVVDHGLEGPDDRVRKGKSECGLLSCFASLEDDQLMLDVIDDGRGIDVERVLDMAIKNGLVTESQGQAMSREEKIELVFLPGLSTARFVTTTSGMGVGMDAIRGLVETLGGRVWIEKSDGSGTRVRIVVPGQGSTRPAPTAHPWGST